MAQALLRQTDRPYKILRHFPERGVLPTVCACRQKMSLFFISQTDKPVCSFMDMRVLLFGSKIFDITRSLNKETLRKTLK